MAGQPLPKDFLAQHKEELSNNESTESGVTVPGGLPGPRRWLGVRGEFLQHTKDVLDGLPAGRPWGSVTGGSNIL